MTRPYLESRLTSVTLRDNAAVSVIEQAESARDPQPWLEALAEFEVRLERRVSTYQNVYNLTLLCVIVLLYFTHSPLTWYLAAGVGGSWLLGLIVDGVNKLRGAKPQSQLDAAAKALMLQIEHADLAERIASGQISGNEPAEYTPASARRLLPALDGSDRVRLLTRVATWLEWYLGPPRRETNKYWQMALSFAGLPMMLVLLGFMPGTQLNPLFGLVFMLFFSTIVSSTYVRSARLMVMQLRADWSRTEPADSTSADAPETPAPALTGANAARTRQIQLVVNQAQLDLVKSSHMILMVALMGNMLASLVFLTEKGNSSLGLYAMFPGVMFVALLGTWQGWPQRKRYAKEIRAQLDRSALAQRLIGGELDSASLEARVPLLLRGWLEFPGRPKAHADELRMQLWRLAFNLDCYLAPSRVLLRGFWFCQPLQLLAAVAIGMATLGNGGWPILTASLVLQLLLTVPTLVYYQKCSIWIEELTAYLRRCAAPEE